MEYLEQLAAKYSGADASGSPGAEASTQPGIETTEMTEIESAEKLAHLVVGVMEFGFQRVDDRVEYLDKVYEEANRELAPALEKHGFGIGGDMPMEEAKAGRFIGRLWRKTKEAIRAFQEEDEKAKHGEARKYETTEQTSAVSGKERSREESNIHSSQWDQANG